MIWSLQLRVEWNSAVYARETKNIQVMLPIAYTDKQEFTLKKENNFPWNYKKAKMQVTASEGESKQTMQLCRIIRFHCFAEKHQLFFMQNVKTVTFRVPSQEHEAITKLWSGAKLSFVIESVWSVSSSNILPTIIKYRIMTNRINQFGSW